MLLGPIRHLLNKATSPRSGNATNYLICTNKHRKLDKIRQQRNTLQMKEQDKASEEELSEDKQYTNKESKVMIIKMLS